MKRNIDLEGMRAFVAVSETKSFTAAANRLASSKSTISRRIDAYENALGVTLFRRSTRSISLTDLGIQHFEKTKELIMEAEAAIEDIVGLNTSPSGLIRFSGSLTGGQRLLLPFVWRFMDMYPNVRVEMVLTDDIVDVVGAGIDFTLRMGELADSELIARNIGKGKRVIVASPDFLSRYLVPRTLKDLKKLPAIITSTENHIWRFENGDSLSVSWRMCAGAIPVAVQGALRGIGMALVPVTYCHDYLVNGELIQLLPELPLPEVDISLVYPRLRHQSPAAKAFLQVIKNNDINNLCK